MGTARCSDRQEGESERAIVVSLSPFCSSIVRVIVPITVAHVVSLVGHLFLTILSLDIH